MSGATCGEALNPGCALIRATLANYAEANRTFFRQTVLPLAQRVGSSIAQWLSPQFGDSIRVTIDTDRIDALAADRAALWDRVSNAPFLTLNEKREAVGYGPVAGGGVIPCPGRDAARRLLRRDASQNRDPGERAAGTAGIDGVEAGSGADGRMRRAGWCERSDAVSPSGTDNRAFWHNH
jgi:hypothetical protein